MIQLTTFQELGDKTTSFPQGWIITTFVDGSWHPNNLEEGLFELF